MRFAMQINLGGSLPNKLRQVISSKQATLIEMFVKEVLKNPQEIEDTFKEFEERIIHNINTQKEERAAKAKAIEDKRLRKEAKMKAKQEAIMLQKAQEEAALASKT